MRDWLIAIAPLLLHLALWGGVLGFFGFMLYDGRGCLTYEAARAFMDGGREVEEVRTPKLGMRCLRLVEPCNNDRGDG